MTIKLKLFFMFIMLPPLLYGQNKLVEESIIYSRAYNIFLNKEYMGYSLNDLRYEAQESNEETRADFEVRALAHLSKLAITDKVFYSNYFSDHSYKP